MTTEPKLLTEAEAQGAWSATYTTHGKPFSEYLTELRERGLIAPEPEVDPLLEEAREVCAKWAEDGNSWVSVAAAGRYRDGEWDDASHMVISLAALRRGMELGRSDSVRPPLTREQVRDAWCHAHSIHKSSKVLEDYVDRLHAFLLKELGA